jgi:carbamate kinase
VTLVTQTLVDRNDPAFAKPDKPIGSFLSEEVANAWPPSSAGP